MFIRLFILSLHFFLSQISASCPYIRTSVILSECVFDQNLYLSLGANIFNLNSINFIGYYSFLQTNQLNNTLIYNINNRWMLVVPLALKCAKQPMNIQFTECQYTMRQTKYSNRLSTTSEYMTTQLSLMNITDLGTQSVMFLQPGEITLRSCKAYDCSQQIVYLTASNETFHLKINYEKPIDSQCQYNEDCQISYSIKDLIYCDKTSQTCQCSNSNISNFDLPSIGRLCTDSIDQSNCTKFARRCLKWCDQSETSNCLCPKSTRKVRKINGFFDCELEPNGKCQFNDEHLINKNIRKCPTGTYCDGKQCRSITIFRQIIDQSSKEYLSTTSRRNQLFSSLKSNTNNNIFLRNLIVIFLAVLLFFILIILIIILIIKSNHFHISSNSSSEDKVSSSSFVQSTSTALSTDSSTNMNYHQQILFNQSTFVHGLVPQANLTPRFHRQQQTIDDKRRIPLHIRSPSLSRINPFIDHASLKTNEHLKKSKIQLPQITRLENGDVIISA